MWVFFFSITWNDRTLFSYANELLVQNGVVQAVVGEASDIWSGIIIDLEPPR